MSDLRPPPAFALLALLRSSAKLLFWVLAINLLSSAVVITGLFSGVEAVPLEQSALAPIPFWAWLLVGLPDLVVLVACLRFAWPLLNRGALPPSLLESSLRRLVTMWVAIGAVALLGFIASVGVVVWTFTTAT